MRVAYIDGRGADITPRVRGLQGFKTSPAAPHNPRRLGNLDELCGCGGWKSRTTREGVPHLGDLCASAGAAAVWTAEIAPAAAHNPRRLGNLDELCGCGGWKSRTTREGVPRLGDLCASAGPAAVWNAEIAPAARHNPRRLGNLDELRGCREREPRPARHRRPAADFPPAAPRVTAVRR